VFDVLLIGILLIFACVMVGILEGFFFLDVSFQSFLGIDFFWKMGFCCFLLLHHHDASIFSL